MRVNNFHFWVN